MTEQAGAVITKCEVGGCKEAFERPPDDLDIPFGWLVQWSTLPGQPLTEGHLVVRCPGHRSGACKPGEGG